MVVSKEAVFSVLPDIPSLAKSIIETARDMQTITLIDAINRTAQLTNDNQPTNDIAFSLEVHTALPPTDPILEQGFGLLDELLAKTKTDDVTSLNKRLNLLLLAEVLIYQTKLPIKKKAVVKSLPKKTVDLLGKAAALESKGKPKENSAVQPKLVEAMDSFKSKLAAISNLKTEEDLDAQKKLTLLKSLTTFLYDSLVKNCMDMADPAFIDWMLNLEAKTAENLIEHPKSKELLLNGAFKDLPLSYIVAAWTGAWGKPESQTEQAPSIKDLINFLTVNKDVARRFWEFFVGIAPGQEKPLIIPPEKPMIEIILGDSPDELWNFLKTIPFAQFSFAQQTTCARRLLAAYAELKTQSPVPQDSNLEMIPNYLREQLGSPPRESLISELEIAEDKKPGILYENLRHEAIAWVPRPNETREQFEARIKQEKVQVVYRSKAQWPEPVNQKKAEEETPALPPMETGSLKFWGKCLMPKKADVPAVLDMLSNQLANLPFLTQDAALDLWTEYQEQAIKNNSCIVLPDLLPANHPLRLLKDIGILGIEHQDNQASFLLCLNGARIVLLGELNQAGNLTIPGSDKSFELSTLHLLLNSACLFGKSPILQHALTRDDISSIHSLIKTWNRKAKLDHLPLLRFDETAKEPKVILPIGSVRDEKLALLALEPPKS